MNPVDINAELTKVFASKRASINKSINDITPFVGQKISTEVIPPLFIAFARNIGDLYDFQEIVTKSMLGMKTEETISIEKKVEPREEIQ